MQSPPCRVLQRRERAPNYVLLCPSTDHGRTWMELLKLVALDRDDLEVVSTHLQDALVSVGDVHWRPAEKRLAIGLARFDWEGALANSPRYQRRRTALRFERVNSFKCRNVDCCDKQAM